MNILLLLSGIADPTRHLPPALDAAALRRLREEACVLSPFDEAALEIALKLRDRDPATRIAAWTVGTEPMARKIAAFPVESTSLLQGLPEGWDGAAWTRAMGALQAQIPFIPHLVLMGREFGDWDDGTLPVLLAHAWGLRYLSLTTQVQAQEAGRLLVTRQGGADLEQVHAAAPLLLSVTNAPSNRLRHPLMKNVMLAKKAALGRIEAPCYELSATLLSVARREPAPRAQACEMIGGGTQEQASILASRLHALLEK